MRESNHDVLLKFIAQQVTQLHDDFRADLAQMESRMLARIDSVAKSVHEDSARLTMLENTRAYQKGAVWAISAIVAGAATALGLAIRLLVYR